MRILHFYPKDNDMIARHVSMLAENMGLEAEHHLATDGNNACTLLQGSHYDLLHLHGCWRTAMRKVVNLAVSKGTRLVLTPHGQLEPWEQEEDYWKEKLPKRLLFQQSIVRQSYAVLIQGDMERECMEKLRWNSRCTIIRNAIVTNSIQPQEMARQTFAIYQKILDSNTLELMEDETRAALKNLLKAGITGDLRWLDDRTGIHDATEWRKVLCYAHQEHITDIIRRGIRVMELDAPDIDVEHIPYYLPDGYQEVESIQHAIGNQFASENDRLVATFRTIRHLLGNRQLRISHLVELDQELRRHSCEEDLLAEMLHERKLWITARRMMQLLAWKTGLTEGFMPMPALNDREARRISRQMDNNLKI